MAAAAATAAVQLQQQQQQQVDVARHLVMQRTAWQRARHKSQDRAGS
jgi:hypothetical protein